MFGSEQAAGPLASKKLTAVTTALPGSAQSLPPASANGLGASGGLRRAPSRKRGRAAAQGQQANTATLAAIETAPGPTSTSSRTPAEPGPAILKGSTHQPVEGSMHTLPEGAAVDPEQAAEENRRNPRRGPQQSKAAAVEADALPKGDAGNSELLSDASVQSASASASDNAKDALKKAKRNSRQTGTAVFPLKLEEQATAGTKQGIAAPEQPGNALHVKSEPSGAPASPPANDVQAAHPTDKPKAKRKAQQSKAQGSADAAPQNGNIAKPHPAAEPAAKMNRQKRAKIEKVVAEASAAVAQEAEAQDPSVTQASVDGLDEHKPRKGSRPAKKAAPPPTDAADGDISASEASASEGNAGVLGGGDPAGGSAAAADGGKASKPRKRASRAKKAVAAPDAATDEVRGSAAGVAGSDASMSDASVSQEAAAQPADVAGAGKTAKPRKRAPRTKKAAAPDDAAASSLSEASEGQKAHVGFMFSGISCQANIVFWEMQAKHSSLPALVCKTTYVYAGFCMCLRCPI